MGFGIRRSSAALKEEVLAQMHKFFAPVVVLALMGRALALQERRSSNNEGGSSSTGDQCYLRVPSLLQCFQRELQCVLIQDLVG